MLFYYESDEKTGVVQCFKEKRDPRLRCEFAGSYIDTVFFFASAWAGTRTPESRGASFCAGLVFACVQVTLAGMKPNETHMVWSTNYLGIWSVSASFEMLIKYKTIFK